MHTPKPLGYLQSAPHPPQLLLSVSVSTHLPLQRVRPVGQWHCPPAHMAPSFTSHCVPHAPQLLESDDVSVH